MEYEIKIGNRTRKLKIDVVPYRAHKINATLETRKAQLMQLADEESVLMQRKIELRSEKPDGWFRDVRAIQKEIRDMQKEAIEITDKLFFTDRFEIVKTILSKNGIEEDDTLMTRELWEEDIDVTILNDFIGKCLGKKKE